ncbi:alanine racemase [Millisia brevis]|uniref:alanine racemase n=1 Tax=Millisia brevis TaxID=264148 RepID=UPI000A011013|nr:alanine racemase [Millisia brevis]
MTLHRQPIRPNESDSRRASVAPAIDLSLDAVARRLNGAFDTLAAPVLALDMAALRANVEDLRRRALGTPIRLATKSIRVEAVIDLLVGADAGVTGFRGAMAYSAAEAVYLARRGVADILVGYPTVDRATIAEIAADDVLRERITLMVDSGDQVGLVADAASGAPVRLCLDIDASLRIGPAHLGVRRSPLRTPAQAAAVAADARARGLTVVGVMFYEAQVAGMPDRQDGIAAALHERAVALVKRRTMRELSTRRTAVVDAVVDAAGPIELVNSGGTGSISESAADPVVTEVTAGSGVFGPTLFDRYTSFRPHPALMYALPIVRTPGRRIATAFSGGYIASGPPSASRAPSPVALFGAGGVAVPLRGLVAAEGAGEVQTPIRHRGTVRPGDRLWMRHAKSGEICERFDRVHLVEPNGAVTEVPTYRGAGLCFG